MPATNKKRREIRLSDLPEKLYKAVTENAENTGISNRDEVVIFLMKNYPLKTNKK